MFEQSGALAFICGSEGSSKMYVRLITIDVKDDLIHIISIPCLTIEIPFLLKITKV
jgi:hypothetical protein